MNSWWLNNRSEHCSLLGCTSPKLLTPPHHHHYWRGHLSTSACQCSNGGEPGTTKKEK